MMILNERPYKARREPRRRRRTPAPHPNDWNPPVSHHESAAHSAPLSHNRQSFARANRGALAKAFVTAALGAIGLIAVVVGGIVIEGHKLHGALGTFSVGIYGAAFLLAMIVGITLPIAWWRRDRRMRQIASAPHELQW